MIIKGISAADLEAARDVASTTLGNELVFSEFESHRPNRHRVRLQVADIDGPGARRHSHMYCLGYGNAPRRSRHACGHAYGFLFVAIYERAPMCRIQTAFAVYRDVYDFLAKYPSVFDKNVGSRMVPLRFGDECTCETDDIGDDPLRVGSWHIGVPEMPTPENTNRREVSA
jgi:hypothetical protein